MPSFISAATKSSTRRTRRTSRSPSYGRSPTPSSFRSGSLHQTPTPAVREVLPYLETGMTYTEIGKALFKSERWIEECVKASRDVLEDVPTREVVAAAKEAGWTWVLWRSSRSWAPTRSALLAEALLRVLECRGTPVGRKRHDIHTDLAVARSNPGGTRGGQGKHLRPQHLGEAGHAEVPAPEAEETVGGNGGARRAPPPPPLAPPSRGVINGFRGMRSALSSDRLMSVDDVAVEKSSTAARVVLPVPAKPEPVRRSGRFSRRRSATETARWGEQ